MYVSGLIQHTQFFKNKAELAPLAPIIDELASAFNKLTEMNLAIHLKIYNDVIARAAADFGKDAPSDAA